MSKSTEVGVAETSSESGEDDGEDGGASLTSSHKRKMCLPTSSPSKKSDNHHLKISTSLLERLLSGAVGQAQSNGETYVTLSAELLKGLAGSATEAGETSMGISDGPERERGELLTQSQGKAVKPPKPRTRSSAPVAHTVTTRSQEVASKKTNTRHRKK